MARRKPQLNREESALGILQSIQDAGAESVGVSFSGGKDSLIVLDLACRVFGSANVHAFYLYFIRHLECVEPRLAAAERRWGITVTQLPNPAIADALHWGDFSHQRFNFRRQLTDDAIQRAFRHRTGCRWLLFGHRADESLQRRGMISSASDPDCLGRSTHLGKAWPIHNWTGRTCFAYLRNHDIPLPPDFGGGDTSDLSLTSSCMLWLHQNYPADYERFCRQFPMAESLLVRDFMDEIAEPAEPQRAAERGQHAAEKV